jgi:hypothetical protein
LVEKTAAEAHRSVAGHLAHLITTQNASATSAKQSNSNRSTRMSKATSGRGAGPSVSQVPGHKPIISKKTSFEATGKTRDNADLAKGGKGKMFGEQQAGTKKPNVSGKPDTKGPGKKFAEGGDRPTGFNGALPALPSHTSIFSSDPFDRQRTDYRKG